MNVHLLLLLALAGPFYAFTVPSPTGISGTDHYKATDSPDLPEVSVAATDVQVVTGPPPTTSAPSAAAAAPQTTPVPVIPETEAAVTAAATAAPTSADAAADDTAAPDLAVDATTISTTVPETTQPVHTMTAAMAHSTVHPTHDVVITGRDEKIQTTESVVIEEDLDETGLSTGQVVGIVIGALLAVIIVIAVVIAVVRRMGKYSSATKNKKPAKKDSVVVSPLKKRASKQQERPKFWKF